jgi:hypothetical protein
MYSGGRIKIGYSRGAEGRLKTLKTSGPFKPVILLVLNGNMGDEADLHVRFQADRLHGEWFTLSKDMRSYLRARLCDVGRATLQAAEAEFGAFCEAHLAAWKPVHHYKPRPVCDHGMPLGCICPPCERARDLDIVARIDAGTYETVR